MRFMLKMAAAAAAMTVAATAAQAFVIVQYRQLDGAPSIQHVNSGSSFTISSIGTPGVRITLFDPNNPANELAVDGTLTFTGTGNSAATVAGDTASLNIDSGSFALTANESFSFAGFTGTNILSGSFTDGFVTGTLGTRNPAVSVSAPVSTLSGVTSDFFTFGDTFRLDNFSITTSGATPALSIVDGRLSDFQAASVGTFDAVQSVIPEPATWAMMIAGFGLVGVAMRRRQPLARALA